jgi:hypothetical protein
MHGKTGMRKIVDTIEAKKIIRIQHIAAAPDADMRVNKMKQWRYYG